MMAQAMSSPSVGPLKTPRYSVWVWYVSQVENHMGKHGTSAVKTPAGVVPRPMAAVSRRLARVQLRESIPWSKSSPSPLEVPVLRACLPSTLSIVWYMKRPKAKLKYSHAGPYNKLCVSGHNIAIFARQTKSAGFRIGNVRVLLSQACR